MRQTCEPRSPLKDDIRKYWFHLWHNRTGSAEGRERLTRAREGKQNLSRVKSSCRYSFFRVSFHLWHLFLGSFPSLPDRLNSNWCFLITQVMLERFHSSNQGCRVCQINMMSVCFSLCCLAISQSIPITASWKEGKKAEPVEIWRWGFRGRGQLRFY